MTEDNQKPGWHGEIEESLADPVTYHMEWNGRTTDWFLQNQVMLVNNTSLSMGITLFTAGGMVSGQLIGAEEYFRLYAELFSAGFPEEQREKIRETYTAYGKQQTSTDPEEDEPSPQFIHLKDAKLSGSGGLIPTNGGLLWRGSIASISGFSLGSLSS